MEIICVSPHPLTLAHPDRPDEVTVVPPSGVVLNARAVEEPAGVHCSGVVLVKARFVPVPESEAALAKLEMEHPGALIVGSLIAAQAFPGRAVAVIPLLGFERVPPMEKRMRIDKFTTFG